MSETRSSGPTTVGEVLGAMSLEKTDQVPKSVGQPLEASSHTFPVPQNAGEPSSTIEETSQEEKEPRPTTLLGLQAPAHMS